MQEVTAEVRQTTGQLTGLLDNLLHWAASQSGELAYRPEALSAADAAARSRRPCTRPPPAPGRWPLRVAAPRRACPPSGPTATWCSRSCATCWATP